MLGSWKVALTCGWCGLWDMLHHGCPIGMVARLQVKPMTWQKNTSDTAAEPYSARPSAPSPLSSQHSSGGDSKSKLYRVATAPVAVVMHKTPAYVGLSRAVA